MKPNFALTLSFNGIGLLHRSPSGWLDAGAVPFDHADLPAALAQLRKTAGLLDPAPLRTKLVIPNEQIRYLSLPAPARDTDLAAHVATALDGATPYTVSDLVYDWIVVGKDLHVAAIARETLDEAEEFALTHAFAPVSFAAIPDLHAFPGEPFFGLTASAANLIDPTDRLMRDTHAIRITGKARLPDPAPVKPAVIPAPKDEAPEPPLPAFSSRRAAPSVPEAPSKNPKPVKDAAPAPATEDTPLPVASPDQPLAALKADAPRHAPDTTKLATTSPTVAAPARAAAAGPAPRTAPPIPAASPDIPKPTAFRSPPPPPQPETAPSGLSAKLKGLFKSAKTTPKPRKSAAPPPSAAPVMASSAPAATTATMTAARTTPAQPRKSTTAQTEQERMTIFGARKPDSAAAIRGKPRYLGLILTGALLVFLAGVAAFSSIGTDTSLRGFFGGDPETSAPQDIALPAPAIPLDQSRDIATPPDAPVDLARLDDSAMLSDIPQDDLTLRAPEFDPDRLRDPLFETAEPEPVAPAEPDLSPESALASYAATGIWQIAPDQPQPTAPTTLDDLYIASIDTSLQNFDAVALPQAPALSADQIPEPQSNPAPAGTTFALDDRGLVIATPDGAQTPEGITVFAGRPLAIPPAPPARLTQEAAQPDPDSTLEQPANQPAAAPLGGVRPLLRPTGLIESNERATLGGLSLAELGERRPRVRPETLAAVSIALRAADTAEEVANTAPLPEEPAAESPALTNATAQAIATSLKPLARPSSLAATSATTRAQPQQSQRVEAEEEEDEPQQVAAATLAPQRNAAPQIPSTASVSQQATVSGALNLRQINLIGVYGQPSNRRALVRLSNGRYQKVQIGDRLDGGQVRAISESELSYVKGNRAIVLSMPRG